MIGIIIAAVGWIVYAIGLLSTWPAIGISIVGIGIYFAFAFQRTYQYEEKIDNFENSRPRIIPKPNHGVYPVFPLENAGNVSTTHSPNMVISPRVVDVDFMKFTVEQTTEIPDSEKVNQSWFALVDFYNQPIEHTENSVAREVTAHVTYYDKDCKTRIKNDGIPGRWWSNEEVAVSNKPRRELERTDILPGTQPVVLALACMGTKESAIYGYNNDNHEYKDFKK